MTRTSVIGWGALPPRVRHRLMAAVVIACAVLSITGCSHKSPDESPRLSTTTSTTVQTADSISLLEVMGRDPQFATFVKVVQRAGASKLLTSKGAYTVVVPDKASFDKLDSKQRKQLLSDRTKAKAFVDRHLILGRVSISDMMRAPRSTLTSRGGQVPVSFNGKKVSIGGAQVLKYDIEAQNGLIDIVDGPVR